MAFTVAPRNGTLPYAEFDNYLRFLRGDGLDIARAPRVPAPGDGHRWLYVWDTEAEAKRFAKDVNSQSPGPLWRARRADGPVSRGPLDLLVIQLGLRYNGWTFQLHHHSRVVVTRLFPDVVMHPNLFVGEDPRYEGKPSPTDFPALVRTIAPLLTGLTPEQLAPLGYRVINDRDDREVLFSPPAEMAQGNGLPVPAPPSVERRKGGSNSQAFR